MRGSSKVCLLIEEVNWSAIHEQTRIGYRRNVRRIDQDFGVRPMFPAAVSEVPNGTAPFARSTSESKSMGLTWWPTGVGTSKPLDLKNAVVPSEPNAAHNYR